MNWIKITDKVPLERQECWICDLKGNVTDGIYLNSVVIFSQDDKDSTYEPGFLICDETGLYLSAKKVHSWMEYFTPQPPKDLFK